MSQKNAARRLFLESSFGVLSTISVDVPGYPFGSVTPYCADRENRPVIYISPIAQHTRNITADARVSLTVFENNGNSDDVQAQGRITCIGDARLLDPGDNDTPERYFRHFPPARQYANTHSFEFFRLDLVRVRFIGGFGQIYWIEPEEFATANPFSEEQESRILQHMNNDHPDALAGYAGGKPTIMTGIDAEGFDLLAAGKKMRLFFEAPIRSVEEARQALISMTKRTA